MSDSDLQPHRTFPTTRWSLVQRVREGDRAAHGAALDALLRRYLPALRAHLLMIRRLKADQVDDLLQSFISDKVLEQNLIAAADRSRGRFRSFLLVSLDRYVVDQLRRQKAQKRSPGHLAGSEAIEQDLLPVRHSEPFDHAWAQEVLKSAVDRMRDECRTAGRDDVWGVFEHRILAPAADGTEPMPYETLVAQFHLQSPAQASNVLVTAKRMFARILREVVGEYAEDEAEVDEEIRELKAILARA